MAQRKITPGETRWVTLVNGTTYCGFHVRLERRWEVIEFRVTAGVFYALYSRQTGKIDNGTKNDHRLIWPLIVNEDPGFKNSTLKEII